MWVKVCANTNLADAQHAAASGADAVGFVFAPSPRRVTAAQVAGIVADLPHTVERIGVFSSLDADEIVATFHEAGLSGVQLHGGEVPALAAELRRRLPAARLVQTNHWRVGGQSPGAFQAALQRFREDEALDAVLVDSRTAVADGGTGVVFDWQAARDSLQGLGTKPLIVAGGLTPANVREAIAVLRPWGVDVASGVEESAGKKDAEKVRRFIAAAKDASI